MTDAEMLFNQIFLRSLRLWATITNFRDSVLGVIDAVSKRQQAQIENVYDMLAYDPDCARLLSNQRDFAEKVDKTKFVTTAAGEIMARTTSSLDAATVVFVHSILDAAAIDYCRVTAMAAPSDWEPDLRGNAVRLTEIRGSTYDELLRRKLGDRLQSLERESLLTKIDRLLARCQPPAGWSPMNNYKFDLETMKRLDEQRHDIVHGLAIGRPLKDFPLSPESLWYLQRTLMYFAGLVNRKYGLMLDPAYTETFMASYTPHTNPTTPIPTADADHA